MSDIEVVVKVAKEDYLTFSKLSEKEKVNELSYYERIIANGIPLLKGQFIAICDSDYPITEKVENTLKETAFVGGDEEEEDMYCFDIKEIIKADKEEEWWVNG